VKVSLKDILAVLDNPVMQGDENVLVSGVTYDSRKVTPGGLFAAITGEASDGHKFIPKAIEAGAAAVLAERQPSVGYTGFPWITVQDTKKALGAVAALMFSRPTEKLVLVGITGTNGKTTLTYLLESITKAAGGFPGVVGTVSYRWGDQELDAARTTPEASDLQAMFADMVEAGVTHAFIEVSSHGLHRGRLEGCQFNAGVFTNLTQDHLDYHGNVEDYYLAKRTLFSRLLPESSKNGAVAVINLDDPFGRRLANEIEALQVVTYGKSSEANVRPIDVALTASGISGSVITPEGELRVSSPLTGSFNLENILAAVAVANSLGIPSDAISNGIGAVAVVPGRLERVPSELGSIFVDYAHTPSALKNVLEALHTVRKGRIITVMGCGGDRDKTKRPLMGMEAAAGSDFVVVTSDNPRSEDPMLIIRQVEEGVLRQGFAPLPETSNCTPFQPSSYKVIADRREAISLAVGLLHEDDILLVAGKGHETYQEMNGHRYPFDDRQVIREELEKRAAPPRIECGERPDHNQSRRDC
jgi:UDP-N-acetylmuramoyl-L-alanyl-D-glutamate--2,6-diaminopimelate ligase